MILYLTIPRLTERKIMDNRNVFVAIALSMSVLLFWGAFFETPKNNIENQTNRQIENKNTSMQPSANQAPEINQLNIEKKISRNDSINKSNRVKIENNNIIGSISLEGGLIDDISLSHEIINKIGPEHLHLQSSESEEILQKVNNAGGIFLGNYSTEAFGDYVAGTNHILPTSGAAKFSSGLGVIDFMKKRPLFAG